MNTTINAAPTFNATALFNSAIDLGIDVTECAMGDGFIMVKGAVAAVTEWVNGTPGAFMDVRGDMAWAAREVRARPAGWAA